MTCTVADTLHRWCELVPVLAILAGFDFGLWRSWVVGCVRLLLDLLGACGG